MCVYTEKTNSSVIVKEVKDKSVDINKQQKVDVVNKDLPVKSAYSLLIS